MASSRNARPEGGMVHRYSDCASAGGGNGVTRPSNHARAAEWLPPLDDIRPDLSARRRREAELNVEGDAIGRSERGRRKLLLYNDADGVFATLFPLRRFWPIEPAEDVRPSVQRRFDGL